MLNTNSNNTIPSKNFSNIGKLKYNVFNFNYLEFNTEKLKNSNFENITSSQNKTLINSSNLNIKQNFNTNSSHNDDSCSGNLNNNFLNNSHESIINSPNKKILNLKLEDIKNVVYKLEEFFKNRIKNDLNFAFNKISNFSNSEFILEFADIKEQIKTLLNDYTLFNKQNMNSEENLLFYTVYLCNYFEGILEQIKLKLYNSNINNIQNLNSNNNYETQSIIGDQEFNLTAMSDDCLFEHDNYRKTKINSLCFDVINKRDRAMSENDDDSLTLMNILKNKEITKEKFENLLENNSKLNVNNDEFIEYTLLNSNNENFKINHSNNIISINDFSNFSNRSKIVERKLNFNKKSRLSSEEMEKRIKDKLEQAEKNKNYIKQIHTENYKKIMTRIRDIKNKKKLEQIEKMQKLYKKFEKFNIRHQEYLNEKISKVKSENEKIAEIKFLQRMDRENRNINILKKLDISIDRRKKYIEQKLWKTKLRNKKEQEMNNKIFQLDSSQTGKINLNDEIKAKFLNKITKNLKNEFTINKDSNMSLKNDNLCKNLNNFPLPNFNNYEENNNLIFNKVVNNETSKNKNGNLSYDENESANLNYNLNNESLKSNRIIYNQKKQKLEENFEFIRAIYSENFIWELLEADFFDIEELCELSQLTKFELLKSKIKKDKEKIDLLYDNKNKNLKNKKDFLGETFASYPVIENNKNIFNFEEQILADDSNSKDSYYQENMRRSKSFTIFNEEDFLDYNYLFNDNDNQRKKKKKKKKKSVDDNITENISNCVINDDSDKIKNKLIKTINSMSQKTITTLYKSMNCDKKMKKFLVKSKNGKYVKSRILIKNEEINKNNTKNDLSFQKNNDNIKISCDKNSNIVNYNNNNLIKIPLLEKINIPFFQSNEFLSPNFTDGPNSDMIKINQENEINTNKLNEIENKQTSNYKNSINSDSLNIYLEKIDNEINKKNCNINSSKMNEIESKDKNLDIVEIKSNHEKIIQDIVLNNNIINLIDNNTNNNNGKNTLIINSESVTKILEENAITVKWCKLCNVIVN